MSATVTDIILQTIANFSPEDMVVSAIYSDIPMESALTTGNEKLNQLLSNCTWGMKSNFVDLPTDCPQRDERMGWTGDTQVFSETACILSEPYAFYRKYLYDCEQLAAHGQEKLADEILLNEEYPGWLYAVNLGATTIWERWNSLDETGHVSSTGMNSLNHYSYGAIASYIWKRLAGLLLLPEAPGGRRVKIVPHVNWKLRHIKAEYPSAVGTYFIFWELPDTEHIHLTVTVPAGGEAEVVLPLDKGNRSFTVSGNTLDITYPASAPLFIHRSIDDTLRTLMCNSECRKILKKEIPTLDVLLAFTRVYPLRETMQNLRYDKVMIQRVETRLSKVIE